MELGTLLWETFFSTGSIDAYLLYKDACNEETQEDTQCQTTTQEAL